MADGFWTDHAGESQSGSQSGLLWRDCPINDIESNSGRGFYIRERFSDGYTSAKYTLTTVTTGSAALTSGVEGGALRLSAGAGTAGQGCNHVLGTVGTVVTGQNKNIWFETRVRPATIGSAPQLFLGLSTYSTAIITQGPITLATNDYIGFTTISGGASANALLLALRDNGGTAATIATGATLTDLTWLNLGFKVKTTPAGTLRVSIYVNGVEVAYTLTAAITAAIPDTAANLLAFSKVLQAGGASSTLDVAWTDLYVETSGG